MLELMEARLLIDQYREKFEFFECPKCSILFDHWLPTDWQIEQWLKEHPLVIRNHAGDGESSADL